MIEQSWPEPQERVEVRVRGLVESVVSASELRSLRLEWVTPLAHRLDQPDAAAVALRLMIAAVDDAVFQKEIWTPGSGLSWSDELAQLASDLEDWVCETSFGWAQQRIARVPD